MCLQEFQVQAAWREIWKIKDFSIHVFSLNSFWPGNAIWRQWSGSTLAQVMACCLTAPIHYLNHGDWSSVKSSGISIRAISLEMPQPSITKICLKITYLKFHSNFPMANELTFTYIHGEGKLCSGDTRGQHKFCGQVQIIRCFKVMLY